MALFQQTTKSSKHLTCLQLLLDYNIIELVVQEPKKNKVTTHLLDYFTENHNKGLTTIYYFGDTEIFNKILNCLAQDSLVTRASKLQSIAEHKV